jgi:hypothetical protein
MSEAAAESHKPPEQVLLAALDALPADDRQAVLAWLLGRLGGPIADVSVLRTLLPSRLPHSGNQERMAALIVGHGQASLSEDQRVVPVRFSAAQHAALQAWCQEHGFSMATVIRGLVARFLEERAAEATPPAPSEAAS